MTKEYRNPLFSWNENTLNYFKDIAALNEPRVVRLQVTNFVEAIEESKENEFKEELVNDLMNKIYN